MRSTLVANLRLRLDQLTRFDVDQVGSFIIGWCHAFLRRLESPLQKGRAMCVLLRFLMFAVQFIKRLCTDFWSPYLAQQRTEVRQDVADVTLNPCPSQFWPPRPSIRLGKLLRIQF